MHRHGGDPASPPPEALTVDAWYTLIYLSAAEHRALDERRRRVWSEPLLRAGLTRGAVQGLLVRREQWIRAEEARGHTPALPEQIRRLSEWSGRPIEEGALVQQLERALLRADVRVAPGAGNALRELADRDVPLGLVSNVLNETGTTARTILDRLGLLPSFRAVYFSCEHRWAKPSPLPFLATVRFLERRPSRTAHLGDLHYDVLGARRAGLLAWWYVGLRRLNGYLPGQVAPGEVDRRDTIRSWVELPGRLRKG
jgi:FMN phosphatase YigB (HAD superfamily)